MTRFWIGIGIMLSILAIGIGMLAFSAQYQRDFSSRMEQAGDFALAGNWTEASRQAEKGHEKWEHYRRFWSASTDHEPVEEMHRLFSLLAVYEEKKWQVDFATTCRSISLLAEAIDESHNLKWWTLL
ncbi:MAG: DUF4363 family protein [Ruminococcaceae bacterium]|nr:DUF4363 family protein [Oscillospiraceae bacterium]